MAIITLTSDFGEKDYYVPAFKGEIYSACPSVQVVDISNVIEPYAVDDAAFVLKHAFEHFPKKTIHVVRVFEMSEKEPQIIVCSYRDHFFIAPNNGILSMVFEDKPAAAVMIDHERIVLRSPHDLYCRAIRTLVYNGSLSDLGRPINDIEKRLMLRPVIYDNNVRGIVRHIDHYGNAITNISRNDVEAMMVDNKFTIVLRRNDMIHKLHHYYSDVPQGEQLARFNSKNMLEIAVNCGRADELLGLHEGDNIKIEY
ncbi:MAG: SAM-dependent chlorinase/fluorinase [Chitinophagales bacterium]